MLYFANPSTPEVRRAMTAGILGLIDTPRQGASGPTTAQWAPGAAWIADNSCFGKDYCGDERWLRWLAAHSAPRADCWFATAPDVVGDAKATLVKSLPLLGKIRDLGYAAGFVGQDGLRISTCPWDEFDVLFLGGSTRWKLSLDARRIAEHALTRGKTTHMGRVNSFGRMAYADHIGCASVDGTGITVAPHEMLQRILMWTEKINGR